MIALLLLSRRRDVMGDFATGAMMTPAALIAAILIIALNVVLVLELCDVSLI